MPTEDLLEIPLNGVCLIKRHAQWHKPKQAYLLCLMMLRRGSFKTHFRKAKNATYGRHARDDHRSMNGCAGDQNLLNHL